MTNKRKLYPRPLAPYPLLQGWRRGWPLAPSLGGQCAASPLVFVSQRWPPPSGPAPSDADPAASCYPWEERPPPARSMSTPGSRSSTCFQRLPYKAQREKGQEIMERLRNSSQIHT